MSVYDIAQAISDIVTAVVPDTFQDVQFTSIRPGAGVEPLEWIKQPGRENREFDVYVSELPSPGLGCESSVELEIVIAYRMTNPEVLTRVLIAEDVSILQSAIRTEIATWSLVCDSLWPSGAATTEMVYDADGRAVLQLAHIPLTAYFQARR